METNLQSKVISFLRFPLILGVVFLHTDLNSMLVDGTAYPLYKICSKLFSYILGNISVPLFFFISGFLFFFNMNFNTDSYVKKLKSRCKTLLIPYLFWNTVVLLFYYLLSCVFPTYFSSMSFDGMSLITAYVGRLGEGEVITHPIAGQFWFIRDLMVMVLLSPILYLYVKKIKIWGILVLGLIWLLDFNIPLMGSYGASITALFFFSLGAWFSINHLDFTNILKNKMKLVIWIFPVLLLIELNLQINILYLYKLLILLGVIFVLLCTTYLLERKKVEPLSLLSASSFFIFAIHEPWLLSQMKKIVGVFCLAKNDYSLTLAYFILPVCVSIVAVMIYYMLRKLCPRFTGLITGGR